MKPIQSKIKKVVEGYIKENYIEYCAVCDSVKEQREVQRNDFASTGGKEYLGQLATVMPETLDNLLKEGLTENEWKYYTSKEGTEWFARIYKEFSPAIKI